MVAAPIFVVNQGSEELLPRVATNNPTQPMSCIHFGELRYSARAYKAFALLPLVWLGA